MTERARHPFPEHDPDAFDPLYLTALDEIYHSHWAARKKRRIALLREAVADIWPKGFPARLIHVTGTNGKGSVCHYLAQGLRFAGATGSWTGPHVFDYAERFHIDGEPVGHDAIAEIYRDALEPLQAARMAAGGESLSFAEQGILLALHLFARRGAAWGVMEVGAGGRYTPLMALDMSACVLTNIGLDHPRTLGAKTWQRAMEKAGIARRGKPFFTSAEGEALTYVRRTAEAQGAETIVVGDEAARALRPHFDRPQPAYKLRNLALACAVIRYFYPGVGTADLLAAMKTELPGRFTRVAANVIADIAHNEDKTAKLAEHLRAAYPNRKLAFIVGLTRSRDARTVFAPLAPLASRFTATGASYPGQDPEALAAALGELCDDVDAIADPRAAYTRELSRLDEDDMLVLTGSAYMIDQALNPNPYVRHLNASYGWRTEDRSHNR